MLSPLQESPRRFFFVLVSFSLRLLSLSIIFLSSDIYIFAFFECHFVRSRRPLQIGRDLLIYRLGILAAVGLSFSLAVKSALLQALNDDLF